MAYGKQVQEYRKQAAAGASPVGLVVMLYDGALRFMEGAKVAMGERNFEAQSEGLMRAQKIVLHLMATLDMDRGGAVATNLMSLYLYVVDQLVNANVQDKPELIDNAMRTMSELRQGWCELDKQLTPAEQNLALGVAA